jgi:hypothetical protein
VISHGLAQRRTNLGQSWPRYPDGWPALASEAALTGGAGHGRSAKPRREGKKCGNDGRDQPVSVPGCLIRAMVRHDLPASDVSPRLPATRPAPPGSPAAPSTGWIRWGILPCGATRNVAKGLAAFGCLQSEQDRRQRANQFCRLHLPETGSAPRRLRGSWRRRRCRRWLGSWRRRLKSPESRTLRPSLPDCGPALQRLPDQTDQGRPACLRCRHDSFAGT